jgi:hypothetical protein
MLMDLHMDAKLKKRSILNRKAEPPKARLGRRRVWATFILIAFISCFSKDYSVADKPRTTHYKQYAFIKLNHSFTEFYCLDELYHHESRWDPSARNGSHYGIPHQPVSPRCAQKRCWTVLLRPDLIRFNDG